MKRITALILLTMALGLVALPLQARAEDEGMPGAAPAAKEDAGTLGVRRMKAVVAGMTKAVGDVRLNEADIQSIVQHAKTFHAVGKKEGSKDDAIKKLLDAQFDKTGAYDFELVYGMPALKAWASAAQVDVRHWVRRFLRATSLKIRADLLESSKEMLDTLPGQLAQIEAMREQMGEAGYMQAKQGIERALTMARTMDAAAKTVPAATAEEARLLAAYEKKLDAALDDDGADDDDDASDDDDGSEDDDDGSEDDDDTSED